jgi:LPS export ABC transporter protein LptC
MHKGLKHITGLRLLLLPILVLFITSCENDLNKVKQIASNEKAIVIDETKGVDLIMSDSAKVEMHLTAPLSLDYETKPPYTVMPKGVKVVLYDKKTQLEQGTITADTGIRHGDGKIIEFRKNVVAINAQGDTFKSDELFWDQGTKKIYSHKSVSFVMSDGSVTNGDNFESDDNFLNQKMTHARGVFHVDETATQ